MVLCPDCGKEVPEAKFCKNCGAYIENIKEIQPVVEIGTETSTGAEEGPAADEPQNKFKFCFNCGSQINADFKFCPECGQDLSGNVNRTTQQISGEKSVLIAIILSAFLPGLGQIYLGLDHKGAIFLIAYVISAILILLIIGFVLCFVIWIWALIDTITSTNAINRGEEVKDKLL